MRITLKHLCLIHNYFVSNVLGISTEQDTSAKLCAWTTDVNLVSCFMLQFITNSTADKIKPNRIRIQRITMGWHTLFRTPVAGGDHLKEFPTPCARHLSPLFPWHGVSVSHWDEHSPGLSVRFSSSSQGFQPSLDGAAVVLPKWDPSQQE